MYRKNGVQYFVAGAGAMTDKLGSKSSEGDLVWAGAGYSAFAAVAASPDLLTVNFVNIYGNVVVTLKIKYCNLEGRSCINLFCNRR